MIEVNKKYGCLTVLDNGDEYKSSELYSTFVEEYKKAKEAARPILEELEAIKQLMDENPAFKELANGKRKPTGEKEREFAERERMFRINAYYSPEWHALLPAQYKVEKHYKCQCKCGKIHYYNEETILSKPSYCFRPIAIADNTFNYSISAKNATHRKEKKYEKMENVRLWSKPPSGAPLQYIIHSKEPEDLSLPSEEYCELYNKYKIKQLLKKEEEYKIIVSELPRVNAKNYDIDYTGKQYESLYIEKCVDDHLESKPRFSYRQPMLGRKRKYWHNITVYKQYKCVCTVCGKEQLITCDKFGIYPPTEYGYRAYNGYWSDVLCDCHPISSFQWIVTKLLMDNNIHYKVEYTFDDLYGIHGQNKLRFDFAILNDDGSIKCLIECQGEQHYKPCTFGGISKEEAISNLEYIQKLDSRKKQLCENNNVCLEYINYDDDICSRIDEIVKNFGINTIC